MAATIVWQDFKGVNRGAQERAALLEGQVLGQFQAAVAGLAGSAQRELDRQPGADCEATANTTGAAAIPVLLLGADGAEACSPGARSLLPGIDPLLQQVRNGLPFALGRLQPGGPIQVAVSVAGGSAIATVLPPDWLATVVAPDRDEPGAATWLLDAQDQAAASAGDIAKAMPALATLTTLLAVRKSSLPGALSAAGYRYAYASSILPGGWRLIAAISAEPEHRKALQVLLMRAAELGVLLLIGLAAVVVGADVAFGAPLRRLRDGVRAWRAGDVFTPGDLAGAPIEVQQLARSFAAATAELRDKQAELSQVQREQSLLMLEVHHRVKNNLQIIASLLNLQASRIRLPEARAEFQAARDRIRALATLHRHLYADGALQTINMRSFLIELCGQLFQAIGEIEGVRIQLQIEATELRMSSDEAVPLALIVTEAVTNAVKYAFPEGRPGRVSVSLSESQDMLDLVISDDGVGIQSGCGANAERDGIGLRLIEGFSRQLGATLSVQHGPGTRYSIRMPLRRQRVPSPSEALDATGVARENVA